MIATAAGDKNITQFLLGAGGLTMRSADSGGSHIHEASSCVTYARAMQRCAAVCDKAMDLAISD
jgi:hypothetical protein